jgi:hypothetical protein
LFENDLLRLYSVKDESCLWLLPCKANGIQGAAYPDTGGTKSYASKEYVEKAELEIRKFEISTKISMAKEHRMMVYKLYNVSLKMPTE